MEQQPLEVVVVLYNTSGNTEEKMQLVGILGRNGTLGMAKLVKVSPLGITQEMLTINSEEKRNERLVAIGLIPM